MMTVEFARRDANVTSALANILIGDESALFFLLHSDAFTVGAKQQPGFSMNEGYAASAQELSQFNTQHPLFGYRFSCRNADCASMRRALRESCARQISRRTRR